MATFPSNSVRTKNWGTEVLTDSDLEAQFDLLHAYFQAALNATTGHAHDGTTNQGPKLTPANLVIASQAQGDVLYASSASAWARLGAGTSGQYLKTQGASANPTWSNVVVQNYRREMLCTQASTTTMTVGLGELEVGGAAVTKTSATTLTLGTAGDWAGGSSLRATSTYGYIGVDASGNIKMHTTAPTHSDYGVSNTSGIKRYATWEGTVYRIIGWFYMNATGSGELNAYEVGNLKDGSVPNSSFRQGTDDVTTTSATYEALANTTIHFYSSGRPVEINYQAPHYKSGQGVVMEINLDTSSKTTMIGFATDSQIATISGHYQSTPAQGTRLLVINWKVSSGTGYQRGSTDGQRNVSIKEL